MATVTIQERQRNGFKSYLVSYRDPASGRKRYYKTARKKVDAFRMANDLRILLDTGKPPTRAPKAQVLSFQEVADKLKTHWENKMGEGEISPRTAREYTRIADQLIPRFGRRILSEFETEEVYRYRKEVAGKTSNVNANRHLFILKQIFKYGKEINAIQEDPAASIRLLTEKQHERKVYLKPVELNALLEASKKNRAKFYLPALICLGAEHGASKQESLSLRFQDIDLEYEGMGLVHFHRTKNGMDRTQFLMPRTREYLREWIEHLTRMRKEWTPSPTDYVFCHMDGTQIKSFPRAWREACSVAGFKDLHFHDLRHTYCSNLRLSGADLHDVMVLIGHSDMSMTSRYAHLGGERRLFLQKQLAEHYLGESRGAGKHLG